MNILLVEDNPGDARLIREIMREDGGGFVLSHAERLGEALEILDRGGIDAVLLDLGLPDCLGLEALTRTRARFPRLPIVVLTSSADETAAVEAVHLGAQDYLVKGQAEGRLIRRSLRYAVERKNFEQELKKSLLQKSEALSTLAGGIAHDFNNILSTILINSEMVLFDMDEKSPARNRLGLALQAVARGKELVRQIITYSRREELERRPMRVSPVLRETLKFLRSSLPANVEIREAIAAESDFVLGDPSQVHQILMNLCANAGHAMREKGGVLEVSLEEVSADAGLLAGHPDLKPGPYLRLRVRDTGHGMSPDVMDRIFDPFFTTKKPGEGTGMGLSVVLGIVKAWGGTIAVTSRAGAGSTFEVFLPEIGRRAELESPRGSAAPLAPGRERILLVEDEPVQLESLRELLERLGYRVTARADAPRALEDFRADPAGFDLVMADQTMPGMTGARLAEEILKVRRDVPFILCTGYSETVGADEARQKGIRELVMKPFSASEISQSIRRALGPPPEPAAKG